MPPRAPTRRRREPRVLRLTACYVRTADGWYAAEVPGSIGALTQGRTIEEARENLLDVLQTLLAMAPHQLGAEEAAIPPGALSETVLVVLPE